jgi:hypothetical protein
LCHCNGAITILLFTSGRQFYKHEWAGMLTVSTWTFTSSLWSSDGNMRPNYWAPGGHDPELWNQADLSSVPEVWSTWEQKSPNTWCCASVC